MKRRIKPIMLFWVLTLLTLTLISVPQGTTMRKAYAQEEKCTDEKKKTCSDAADVIYAVCMAQGGSIETCTIDMNNFYGTCLRQNGCTYPVPN